jgi:ribonuclease HI
MLYTADVWCARLVTKGRGKKGRGHGARGFTLQLAQVQHMAMLSITGGLRSSASDLLDIHANILPLQQTIWKECHRATLRMATLAKQHPLAKGIKAVYDYCKRRAFKGRKCYPSPLHKLINKFQINPAKMEKIDPVRHYPKWETNVTTSIAEDTKMAMLKDAMANEDLRVYSDGSMIEGGVGGAAVIMRDGEEIGSKRFYLGSDQEHTVYEVEIVGMILAVQLLKEAGGNRGGTMSLGIDNQAAITAMSAFQSRLGYYLMDAFHNDLCSLIPEHDNRKLVIRWSLGHEGIEGNKAADSQAKRAARGETSDA